MSSGHATGNGAGVARMGAARMKDVERALLAQPMVDDCVVLARDVSSGPPVVVAYVVPSPLAPFSAEELRRRLAAAAPTAVPDACVELRSMPLDEAGGIDEEALVSIEVPDADLAARWEESIRRLPGVRDVAVLVEERRTDRPARHMADLLPGWQEATEDAIAAVTPSSAPRGGPATRAGRMALADGGPLELPADAPRTLTAGLLRTAEHHGDRGIHIVQADGSARVMTYAELLARARRILAGLRQAGLRAGDSVILQAPDLADHLPTFWACLLGGIKPVTVAVPPAHDPKNAVTRKLFNTWTLLERPAILASRHVEASVRRLESALDMEGLRVEVVDELANHPPADDLHDARPQDVAFYQLSSGSTGISKCIQITHLGVVSHIYGAVREVGISSSDVTLNWLPMDHVVPLLMYHAKDVYMGIQQVQLPGPTVLGNPLCWLDYIERYRVTHTWAPNFGYKMLADALARAHGRRWDLSSIKSWVNAGEQVTLPVVSAFLERVAPFGAGPATMQPGFGMAEVCTVMTWETRYDGMTSVHRVAKDSLQGVLRPATGDEPAVVFVDCGPVVPGVQIRIVDGANGLLPEDTIGRLQIKGPVVTPGYLHNAAANAEAMVGDGWFNSGDLGFIHDGRLAITGREKELIIVNGANYYCYEVEDIAAGIPGVLPTYTAACGVADPASGTEALAFFFVFDESAGVDLIEVVKTLRATLAAQIGLSPRYVVPVARSEFPKTTSGKIQRGQLKKALAAGHFGDTLRDLDIRLENASTVPEWFYRPAWRRRQLDTAAPAAVRAHVALIFLDDAGVGERMREAWTADGVRCVTVVPGTAFGEIAADRYAINPISLDDMAALLRAVGEVSDIVHLWNVGALDADEAGQPAIEEGLDRGPLAVATLLRGLAALAQRPINLTVVSTNAHVVNPSDRVSPDRGPLAALVRTAAVEMPWLACRSVDVAASDAATAAGIVLRECRSAAPERVVAYRGQQRFVARLERVDLSAQPLVPPFASGGTYLLSGGLGGVGTEVAKYLLTRFHAHLILVGRGPAISEGSDAGAAARAATLQRLRQLPGDVAYVQADVADEPGLAAGVQDVLQAWGRDLDGVVHLAGVFHDRTLADETLEDIRAVLRPKVQGTLALFRLLRDRPGTVFVAFSSAYGYLGGYGAGAYAAANAFLDAFALSRRTGPVRFCSIGWTLWDDLGMSRGYRIEEAVRTRGFRLLSRTPALNSLAAVLRRDLSHVLIGLDPAGRALRGLVDDRERRAQQLTAYYVGQAGPRTDRLIAGGRVTDRFGRPSECAACAVDALPRTAFGAVDRRALTKGPRGGHAEPVAPSTELEQLLAGIWRSALNQDSVGIHDNFFDLGGTSFLAGQVAGRLREALQRNVDVNAMFQFPTIAAQVAHLSGAEADPAAVTDSQSRGAARRASAQRPRRAAPPA